MTLGMEKSLRTNAGRVNKPSEIGKPRRSRTASSDPPEPISVNQLSVNASMSPTAFAVGDIFFLSFR